jgi:nucleoporin NDC1
MAPLPSARPYRDFLTPALHKRFTDASLYTILLCYGISVWMGGMDNCRCTPPRSLRPSLTWLSDLWSWFPIGPAGIRTLLLFVPALIVYILRVAQWHVGRRNTDTPWHTFRKHAFRQTTISTIIGYVLSAWLYSEVYIWSRPKNARLGYTDSGKDYERIRLNERPFYLRFMFVALAFVQAGVHLWCDYDKIEIPALKPNSDREATAKKEQGTSPSQTLLGKAKPMAMLAFTISAFTMVFGTLVYFVGLRHFLWNLYYSGALYLVSLSKTRTQPAGLPPFFPLVVKFVVNGALLALIWQFANNAFDVYISQAPLKRDIPITNESKDPNGSLLNGLKSKKETVHAISLWELALITERFPERRKTIYGELERKKAPTAKQVTDICLAEIRLLLERIGAALDPKYTPQVDAAPPAPTSVSLVPRISQDIKDGAITGPGQAPSTRMEKFGAFAADIAKMHSSPQNAQNAYAREYLKKGQEKLAQGAKEAEVYSSNWWGRFLVSHFGSPFRKSLRRTAAIIITGAPYSRISPLCNAITTLTNLTIFSIKEDEFGRFQNFVPDIVRMFATAIKKIDEYVATLQMGEDTKLEEVDLVRECLREGLERILRTFGEFLGGLGMSSADVREAKRCAANGPEMAVAR